MMSLWVFLDVINHAEVRSVLERIYLWEAGSNTIGFSSKTYPTTFLAANLETGDESRVRLDCTGAT